MLVRLGGSQAVLVKLDSSQAVLVRLVSHLIFTTLHTTLFLKASSLNWKMNLNTKLWDETNNNDDDNTVNLYNNNTGNLYNNNNNNSKNLLLI